MHDHVRIGTAATTLGVSIDTLRRWERSGRVTFTRKGRQRYLGNAELASLLRERAARDGRAVVRNRIPGIVLGVRRDESLAQVELACGAHRVVALMPRERADALHLKPGDTVTAVMKPSAILVEPD
jgi:molybdopterin-binding protein